MRHAIHVITCNTRVYNFISSLELHITYFQSSPVKLGHPSRTKKPETSSKFIREIPLHDSDEICKKKNGANGLSTPKLDTVIRLWADYRSNVFEQERYRIGVWPGVVNSFVRTRTRMRTLEGARWSKRENA